MQIVILEDHGQDFLEWHIRGGKVFKSKPFQTSFWAGTVVHNKEIKKNDILEISFPDSSEKTYLKYPVEDVLNGRPMPNGTKGLIARFLEEEYDLFQDFLDKKDIEPTEAGVIINELEDAPEKEMVI